MAFAELIAESRLMQEYASSPQNAAQVTVSIVSHGHDAIVSSLLADLATHCGSGISVILTLNIPESLTIGEGAYPFQVKLIRNAEPKGFGANHNAAFTHCAGSYFCVLNPDVQFSNNPFPQLIEEFRKPRIGVVAPRIFNTDGYIQNSARYFPTPWTIVRKLFGLTGDLDYPIEQTPLSPDWVAGMFMLFRKDVYAELAGFDERYFLYYEDVDLCRRLRKRGYDIRLLASVGALHGARRDSRRSLRYAWWHLSSMSRYFARRYLLDAY